MQQLNISYWQKYLHANGFLAAKMFFEKKIYVKKTKVYLPPYIISLQRKGLLLIGFFFYFLIKFRIVALLLGLWQILTFL